MKPKTKQKPVFTGLFDLSLEIERFLDGRSTGAPLMQALYGAVIDEPIPERLLALVRGDCADATVKRTPLRLCNAVIS
jgi:hypothetical protein